MTSNIFFKSRVSLLSRPEFIAPVHIHWHSDDNNAAHELVEFSGRLCYLSFGDQELDGHKAVKGRTSNKDYIDNILKVKHGSVIEHANYSILFEGVSRSLTHELVRHRHFSYSQLSQRYVDETNVAFVVPAEFVDDDGNIKPEYKRIYDLWESTTFLATASYSGLTSELAERLGGDVTAAKKRVRQTARSVLPNCTETKIVTTGNVRAWRFFLQKRGALAADTEIRRAAIEAWKLLVKEAPNLFGDITVEQNAEGTKYLKMEFEDV